MSNITLNVISPFKATVSSFADGTISVTAFTVHGNPGLPRQDIIKKACAGILKQTGAVGKSYKLDIYMKSKYLFTIRSLWWGSRQTLDEIQPDYQLVDNQYIPSTVVVAN